MLQRLESWKWCHLIGNSSLIPNPRKHSTKWLSRREMSIITEDGYVLRVFRIKHARNGTRPAVLLMHGIMGSSRDFVIMGPKKGLAYVLADRGYDVWLGNCRGSAYSRKHLRLNPNRDSTFWDFSWHEVGVYDVPAMISLIKTRTKLKQIGYIGMSMGTTVSYVLGSERSEYNSDLSVIISLAPNAYVRRVEDPRLLSVVQFSDLLLLVATITNTYEIPPHWFSKFFNDIRSTLCQNGSMFLDVCVGLYVASRGLKPSKFNNTDKTALVRRGYSSASLRQVLHYAQNIKSGHFRKYDYGRVRNIGRYGTLEPPEYNLSKVTAPVALFYSNEDMLMSPKIVEELCNKLANCVSKQNLVTFNHLDFLLAIDVVPVLFEHVIKVLERYNKIIR
ncbi:hypothetical protein RI129_010843 [Pyrocoelia pectoralis]|uniref:Lipase n=1 Tax=Pyrocoelia pectoralis TaxID=417401 RepID=A0AAN7V2S8_9COLE